MYSLQQFNQNKRSLESYGTHSLDKANSRAEKVSFKHFNYEIKENLNNNTSIFD